jgi:hypothetical protein
VATQILHQAILQSVWGPPAYCIVRQNVRLFGKELTGVGEFVRGGQGSGKLKFNLRMPAADQLNTLLQVSDGQRLLAIEVIGDVKRRTEVDLGKIRPRLFLTNERLRDPVIAMYLAIGGQAEALRKIYQQYEWLSIREGRIGNREVWWLGGKVTYAPIGPRLLAGIDHKLTAENVSGLLPTRIQVAIGKQDAPLPYWMYQIEYRRTQEEVSPAGRSADLRITTEWADPVLLDISQLTSDLFEPPASNESLTDETDLYLPPVPNMASAEVISTQR